MSDETQTQPAPITEALETFDTLEWLTGATQPKDTIEIYRDGEAIQALRELTSFVTSVDEMRKARANTPSGSERLSIADENAEERNEAYDSAITQIEALRTQLRGTGMTFHVRGVASGEREMMEKSVARKLKAKKAVPYQPAKDGKAEVEAQDAIPGGTDHPDYGRELQDVMIARCITKVVSADGREDTRKWTVEQIKQFRQALPGVELNRLANKVYEVNYMAYEIAQLVDVDFS